jgi:hypothetical protein
MHIDKSETHVISFILHIDSSEDSDPWPLMIEDYHGSKYETIKERNAAGAIIFLFFVVAHASMFVFKILCRYTRSRFEKWGYIVL